MPLCRCSSLYQPTKPSTQVRASSSVANPLSGHAGTYFSVLNSDSTWALSLLTLGRLCDGIIFSSASFTLSTCDFIGAPLSAWSTSGCCQHRSLSTVLQQFCRIVTAFCCIHLITHDLTAEHVFYQIQVKPVACCQRLQPGYVP